MLFRTQPRSLVMLVLLATSIGLTLPLSSQANDCNGHKIKWCFSRYDAKRGAQINLRASLERRLSELPGIITAKVAEQDVISSERSGLGSQVPLYQEMLRRDVQYQADLTVWVETLAQCARELANMNSGLKNSLPRLISTLRDALIKSESELATAVSRLRARAKATQGARKEELQFALSQLEALQSFAARSGSVGAARAAILQALEDESSAGTPGPELRSPITQGLSPLTLALLQEAASLQRTSRSGDASRVALQSRLDTIQAAMSASLQTLNGRIERSQSDLTSAQARYADAQSRFDTHTRELQALRAELNAIPQSIEQARQLEDLFDVYWNCCDNAWPCRVLPDWNEQDDAHYRAYEQGISPVHHAKRCRAGGGDL